jgi:hypothetical protein
MTTKHLTDDDIQQYALNKATCEAGIVEHVQLCEPCKEKVTAYQLLFTSIKQQPVPVFDFDLAELVLTKLPQPKPKAVTETFWIYLPALAGILLAGGLLYMFREYITGLFTGITPLMIWLIVTAVLTILVILCIDMYKGYQKKMNSLDFY